MGGHIFDTNTLRNLALVDRLAILPSVCEGTLYRAGTVKDELDLGPRNFGRAHQDERGRISPQLSMQLMRFNSLSTTLANLKVQDVRLTSHQHSEAFEFFGCCIANEDMDPGEAESFAWAAMRGWSFYTDDLAAKRAVDRYNTGIFCCPPYGRETRLHRPVPVHSTAWLLLEAIRLKLLTSAEAEESFAEMREVWDRHPGQTLARLQERGPAAYW